MNISNLFAAIMGFLVSLVLVYWFWSPIVTIIEELTLGAQLLTSVAAVIIITLIVYYAPIALAAQDE